MRWLNDEQIPAFPFLLFILVLRWFIPPSQEKDSVGFLAVLICAFRFVLGVSSPYRCWGGGVGAGSHCAPREPCAAGRWDR